MKISFRDKEELVLEGATAEGVARLHGIGFFPSGGGAGPAESAEGRLTQLASEVTVTEEGEGGRGDDCDGVGEVMREDDG